MHSPVHDSIAAVWRIESAAIVAAVTRRVRDLGVAEDIAQDALVAALERWPVNGLPQNPGAWLMTTALNRALDHLRHRQMADARHEDIAQDLQAREAHFVPDFTDGLDAAREQAQIGDDLLRLIFTACHPVLSPDQRVALTLKLVCGLTTPEVARACLVPEPTLAQRIVRAKRTLSEAKVPFELPTGDALGERLASVLEVVYLVFNEGYTATQGTDWQRVDLTHEALRLARLLATLAPTEPEVHGLLALLEIQASRTAARVDAQGRPVLLLDQDRARWDWAAVQRGLASLAQADRLNAQADTDPGPYQLQAAIAACHGRATVAEATDWARIAALYGALLTIQPSPVVALNRAVAVGMADGPAAALVLVDALSDEPALRQYQWLPSVRGDLLAKLGRRAEARAEFERAAALAGNDRERALLLERSRALAA